MVNVPICRQIGKVRTSTITDKFGGLLGPPVTYLVSRDGKIMKKYTGVVQEKQIIKDVESQL